MSYWSHWMYWDVSTHASKQCSALVVLMALMDASHLHQTSMIEKHILLLACCKSGLCSRSSKVRQALNVVKPTRATLLMLMLTHDRTCWYKEPSSTASLNAVASCIWLAFCTSKERICAIVQCIARLSLILSRFGREAICPSCAKGDNTAFVRLGQARKARPCAKARWMMRTDTAPVQHTHGTCEYYNCRTLRTFRSFSFLFR